MVCKNAARTDIDRCTGRYGVCESCFCVRVRARHHEERKMIRHLFSCYSVLCFTCSSYGMKAMLISFSVFMRLAISEWHNSLNNSSGHAVKRQTVKCRVDW